MVRNSLYIFIIVIFCSACHSIDFDSEKWKHWREAESSLSLRWDMRNDLVEKHNLKGMNVSEVIDLLGEPEHKSDTEFRYYLGMARSAVDTGYLILTIENGKVTDFRFWHG